MFFKPKLDPSNLEARKFVDWQRQQIIAKVPSNLEGINIPRVLNFMKYRNLKVAPFLVVDESNLDLLRRAFHEIRQREARLNRSILGEVVKPMGLCLVLRVPEYEQVFGSEMVEYFLVHELIHAANWRASDLRMVGNIVRLTRLGLLNEEPERSYGHFFGEGFAQLGTQQYVEHWMGWPHGLGNKGPCPSNNDLPYKYIVRGKYDSKLCTLPAVAAHGLELLISRNRRIYPALQASDADGNYSPLKRSVAAVGGIKLFERLYNLDYNKTDFYAGRQAIVDALR